MPTSSKRKPTTIELDKLFALMDQWPESWAGSAADVPVGKGLVDEIKPFIQTLASSNLSKTTVRRHLDNTWMIGGEIIRIVVDEPRLRKKKPRQLLLDAIDCGEAPLVYGISAQDQRSVDATARKFLQFLSDNSR